MFKYVLALVGLSVSLSVNAAVISSASHLALNNATLIDFNSPAEYEYPDAFELNRIYSDITIDEVTFTSNNGVSIFYWEYLDVNSLYGVNGSYLNGYNSNQYSYIFSETVNAFGFSIGALDETYLLSAFDVNGSLIESVTVNPAYLQYVGLTSSGIKTATFTQLSTTHYAADTIMIEDFRYQASAVPIPAAAWLFSTALLGLAGVKRRHR